MSISHIARSLKESGTLKLNETAGILRAKGDPVIHLGGGEPKSKAPIDALTHAAGVLGTGDIKYTPADGLVALKQSVIRYTEEYYRRRVAPENVIISTGAKQAIMVFLHTVLNPREEVIFPTPYWVSYPDMVKLAGGVPVAVRPEDGSFRPRIEDIAQVCGSYTKAIILNSPNNPSGIMYSREFIAEVVELCERKGLWLVMDDIYHRLCFDGRRPISALDFAKKDVENSRIVIINGVSKQYAMTGFRIGWAVGPRKLIEVMRTVQGHQTSGPPTLSQRAAIGALDGVQSSVETLRLTLENQRNVMLDRLRAIPGLRITPPEGTFYCFPDFSAYDKDSARLSQFLLEKVQVVTVPGVEFGMEGHLRLSYCGTMKDIMQGIERIQWAVDPNSANELYIGDRKLVRDWS